MVEPHYRLEALAQWVGSWDLPGSTLIVFVTWQPCWCRYLGSSLEEYKLQVVDSKVCSPRNMIGILLTRVF